MTNVVWLLILYKPIVIYTYASCIADGTQMNKKTTRKKMTKCNSICCKQMCIKHRCQSSRFVTFKILRSHPIRKNNIRLHEILVYPTISCIRHMRAPQWSLTLWSRRQHCSLLICVHNASNLWSHVRVFWFDATNHPPHR